MKGYQPRPVCCINCRRTFKGLTAFNAHGCYRKYYRGVAIDEPNGPEGAKRKETEDA